MKLSELIKALESMHSQHGEATVCVEDNTEESLGPVAVKKVELDPLELRYNGRKVVVIKGKQL